LLVLAAGIYFNSSFNWGFHLLSFFSTIQIIVLLLFGLVIFLPQARTFVSEFTAEIVSPLKFKYAVIGILILYSISFFVFRVKVHLLGDSPMILRMLPEMTGVDDMIATNEPGSYAVDLFVQKIFRSLFSTSYMPEHVYIFLSYLCGAIFILILLNYLKRTELDKTIKALTFIILFFTSNIILFLGYAETYQLIFTLMLSYLTLSMIYFKGSLKSSYGISLTYGFWLSLHYLASVFFPSYVIVIIYNFRKEKFQSTVSILLFLASFLLGYLFSGLDLSEMSKRFLKPNTSHWLPLFSAESGGTPPAFSFEHLWDLFNSQFLALPFGLLTLLMFIILFYTYIKWKDPSNVFLLIMSISSLFFIFFFNSHLGLSRDWDVAAMMSFPFLFYFVYVLTNYIDPDKFKREYALIAYISLWQTILWVLLNSNSTLSEMRNTSLDNDRLWGNERLGLYYEEVGAYFKNKEQYSLSISYYKKALELGPEKERLLLNVCYLYYKHKQYDRASMLLKDYINKVRGTRDVYFLLSLVQYETGLYDEAIASYELILQSDPNDWEVMGNLASCYYQKKQYQKSMEYSNRVIEINPGNPKAYLGIGDSYLAMGDTSKAFMNYQKARELDIGFNLKQEIDLRFNKISK
jgi:outer membrane protein assembly factor BamD (BamD/ComL family)